MGVARRNAKARSGAEETIDRFMGSLGNGPNVLVLAAIDLDDDGCGGRPATLARALAGLGYRTWYHAVNVKRTRFDSSGVVVLDRHGLLALERMAAGGDDGTVICHYMLQAPVVAMFQAIGWRVVYDMMDDWAGFAQDGMVPEEFLVREDFLCLVADYVTCSAPKLQEIATAKGATETALVYNGGPEWPIDLRVGDSARKPPDTSRPPHTKVGFCGALWGSWIDWDCLDVLEMDACVSGIVMGRFEGEADKSYNRLQLVGTVPYPAAMRELTMCDCGLIPFRGHLCQTVDPVKYYDYAACGLWTVATPAMEVLSGRPYVIFAEPGDWPEAVRQAHGLTVAEPPTLDFVRANSWSARAAEMMAAIGADKWFAAEEAGS